MYAYEHAFSDDEAHAWLDRQFQRYKEDGFGLWAVILKRTGEFLGQAGLTWQECEGEKLLEIGYLFKKKYWHNGYATESAVACRQYAFEILDKDRVYSMIRDINIASQNVARRNGMEIVKTFIKHYYNMDMLHFLFCVKNTTYKKPVRL